MYDRLLAYFFLTVSFFRPNWPSDLPDHPVREDHAARVPKSRKTHATT
jgi:hypothetical protein